MQIAPPRIETARDLPPEKRIDPSAHERPWIDFKETVAKDQREEMAKDVAAFANTYGGVILIGAKDTPSGVEYPGIPREYARHLKEAYEEAAKEWCRPIPQVFPVLIDLGNTNNVVLAVNIEAHLAGVVGAQTSASSGSGSRQRVAQPWRFPHRKGSHTAFWTPEELPMHIDGRARGTILRLMKIPEGQRKNLTLYAAPEPSQLRTARPVSDGGSLEFMSNPPHFYLAPGGPPSLVAHTAGLKEVNMDANRATFSVDAREHQGVGTHLVVIPLLDIEDLWESHGHWNIRVSGRILVGQGASDSYRPVLR
jgi:hypothetical protein